MMTTVPVEVHWADPACARAELLDLLDGHEVDRHSRFVRSADRDRYLVGHALVRILLGQLHQIPPGALEFDRTCTRCGEPHGKPQLLGSDAQFSLSHSGSRVVVAVCPGYPVGVDVETIGSAHDLAGELLDDWELERLPGGADRDRALTTWWARKEAVLKSTGDGLAVEPTVLRVSVPTDPPELLSWNDNPATRIALADLDPGPGYCAALAVVTEQVVTVTERAADALLDATGSPR